MEIEMYDITFIVPLLDRDFYTRVWLKENIRDDCYYIFADGSHDDKNFQIFNGLTSKNIKYIRFNKDQNIGDYIKKMADTSIHLKTKYVMTSDNDDFLNYKGIFKCLNFLENNIDYAFASGKTLFVRQNEKGDLNNLKYKLIIQSLSGQNLNNLTGVKAIEKYLDNNIEKTGYVWYSIYRSEIFKKIWNSMYTCNIRDGQINELLQTCMSFCYGKYKYINCNHYIRLSNPSQNYARSFLETLAVRLVFNAPVKDELIKFINYFAKKLDLDKEKIHNIVKKKFVQKKPTAIYLNSLFETFYLKAFIFVFLRIIHTKFISLKKIINIINLFFFIKK